MALDAMGIGASNINSVVGPPAAPGSGRGVLVQLGKAPGVNLNAVAATSIFTTPAVGGYTRCIVSQIVWTNFSAVASTASISYGASGTPTDFLATATMAGATGTTKAVAVFPASGAGFTAYGVGVSFVANVTIGQGVATTGDVEAWGWYE
jgi:hypothetical protein